MPFSLNTSCLARINLGVNHHRKNPLQEQGTRLFVPATALIVGSKQVMFSCSSIVSSTGSSNYWNISSLYSSGGWVCTNAWPQVPMTITSSFSPSGFALMTSLQGMEQKKNIAINSRAIIWRRVSQWSKKYISAEGINFKIHANKMIVTGNRIIKNTRTVHRIHMFVFLITKTASVTTLTAMIKSFNEL